MPEALKSRKFWVTISSLAAVIGSQYFGVDIDPAALLSLAGIVLAYTTGQGWVDATTAKARITAEADIGRAQLLAYARRLEAELAAMEGQLPEIRPEITE